MRKVTAAFLLMFLLTGCAEQEAKSALKGILTDPGSAKFSGLKKGAADGNVCGFFNAKNRMGGYAGNTPFFYEKRTKTVAIVTGATDREFEGLWNAIGRRSFSEEHEDLHLKCDLVERWDSVCGFEYPRESSSLCTPLKASAEQTYQSLKEKFDK